LTKPIRCFPPRDFLGGRENNLDDLRRFNLATIAYDIGWSMVWRNHIGDNYSC
jgi:hypothetical protein